jgi:predicted oxidoreductase (fatty acid repression mutant protein)
MERTFKDAIKHRRSYYAIANQSPASDAEIEEMIAFAVTHVPSAFNSQTTRVVLLLGDEHAKLWGIVKETLRQIVPADAFGATERKIDSFGAGYGSVLFFEDQSVIKSHQENFPLYADNFPVWSEQTSGMHQLAVWTLLEDAGFGASLQHYNPLIDGEVRRVWSLPESWRLRAQMPFGTPTAEPAPKTFLPVKERFSVFK